MTVINKIIFCSDNFIFYPVWLINMFYITDNLEKLFLSVSQLIIDKSYKFLGMLFHLWAVIFQGISSYVVQ